MRLMKLPHSFTLCKVKCITDIDFNAEFCFIARTDEEFSLVCRTEDTPSDTMERNDGWRGFRIEAILDFSLIGILAKLSKILAENLIGIFVVSTYNTDYIFVKDKDFERAMTVLSANGYIIM